MIPNPNAPKVEQPVLDPAARATLAAALDELIAAWPATDETGVPITHITEGELAHRLRLAPPAGLDPAAIDADAVREALRGRDAGQVR